MVSGKPPQEVRGINSGNDSSPATNVLVDGFSMRHDFAIQFDSTKRCPWSELKSIEWLSTHVQPGLARNDQPLVFQPFTIWWYRPTITQRFTDEMVSEHCLTLSFYGCPPAGLLGGG